MSTALLDADYLCYAVAAVTVDTVDWTTDEDEDVVADLINKPAAREIADEKIAEWTRAAKCKRKQLVFSDRTPGNQTFRYGVHPHYKANRPNEKPELHDFVRQHMLDNYDCLEIPGLEGDDVLGLMGTGPDGNSYVLVSVDKDLMTIPARVCNPDNDDGVVKLSTRQANYNWMYQTIVGDTVDNYKGAPGAGPVAAKQALALGNSLVEWWDAVCHTHAKQFDDKRWGKNTVCATAFEEALMNARCARILRHGDYDKETGRVLLWHPDGGQWIDAVYKEEGNED